MNNFLVDTGMPETKKMVLRNPFLKTKRTTNTKVTMNNRIKPITQGCYE